MPITKGNDWNTAIGFTGGGSHGEEISPGGHVCTILGARIGHDRLQREMLILQLDVLEGSEYDGFFKRQFEQRKQEKGDSVKWPQGGILRQLVLSKDGATNPWLVGLYQCIQESNPGLPPFAQWNGDERMLRNMKLGVIFREEEYISPSGKSYFNVRTYQPRTVAAIQKGVPVPEPLRAKPRNDVMMPAQNEFTPVDEDELPF